VNIIGWNYDIKDIADYPEGVNDPKESVIANGVNAHNYDILQGLKAGTKVLEIGCGTSSWLRDNLPDGVQWEAIDVFEKDFKGLACIATRLGSVHEIPFANDMFDLVFSNQSIEHWHEYGVSIPAGLGEIARVLKVNGAAHINFPIYLHGHPIFLKGNIGKLLECVEPDTFSVSQIIAYKDSQQPNYRGWARCGFPDFYVSENGKQPVETSFCGSLELVKISSLKDDRPANPEARKLEIQPRMSLMKMAGLYGPKVLLWKLYRKAAKRC